MLNQNTWNRIAGNLIRVCSLIALGWLSGCAAWSGNQEQAGPAGKSGLQLWSENCANCHNMRAAESYSDAQWDVATLHMRVRANLTPSEVRAIAAYLKSAN